MHGSRAPQPGNRLAVFVAELDKLTSERVAIRLLLGCSLVPLFGLADFLLYRPLFVRFVAYRLVAAVCCAFCTEANRRRPSSGSWGFSLGMAAAYIVGLSIVAMIVETGGYDTPYYAGLGLVFLGMCVVLPARTGALAVHCAIL